MTGLTGDWKVARFILHLLPLVACRAGEQDAIRCMQPHTMKRQEAHRIYAADHLVSNIKMMSYQNGTIHEDVNDGCDDGGDEKLLHPSTQPLKTDEQRHTKKKAREAIILLFLSAFLFSFMGMFLQFTGRLGE